MVHSSAPVVYVLTNRYNTTLYIGVTSNLPNRLFAHKNKLIKGFSSKYNLTKLVFYEEHSSMLSAIKREKQLKKWRRLWKEELISEKNPKWIDLSKQL